MIAREIENMKDQDLEELTLREENKSKLRKADVWFNLNYFEESFSSLNRSFLESSEDGNNITTFVLLQQIISILISAIWNSSFVVLPLFIVLNFYQSDVEEITEPIILNWWRMQIVAIAFALLALLRRIIYADVYFRKERWFKLVKHSMISGVSLAIWTSGIMYGAQMDSLFTSYLFGYSFFSNSKFCSYYARNNNS